MYFLYHRRSRPTGEVLARALNADHGEAPLGFAENSDGRLIRWGSQAVGRMDGSESLVRVLNPATAIARASDKLESLTILRDRGIPVPDWDTDPEALVERSGYPILGRRIQHARATDVVL